MKTLNYILSNNFISIAFSFTEGVYSIRDAQTNEVLLSNSRIAPDSGEEPESIRILKDESVQDTFGPGRRLVLALADYSLFRHSNHDASSRLPPAHSCTERVSQW